ncbi:MAG: peptidase protein [Microbacteriaceae bacterium]|nr:peptidase protein [Microbacteriaceae bacterium]
MSRRPLDKTYPISCDNACHLSRGSLGGTDYACPKGTPVYAEISGDARGRVAGTGGWCVTINGVGISIDNMHLSGFADGLGIGQSRWVNQDDLLGYSGGRLGDPGSGSATGPHLHVDVYVNGHRTGYEDWFTSQTDTAGYGENPIGEFLMALNEAQQQQMYDALVQPFGYTPQAIIGILRDQVIPKFESGAGYDWLLAIANQGNAILASLGEHDNLTLNAAQVEQLAESLREGLGVEVADALGEKLRAPGK